MFTEIGEVAIIKKGRVLVSIFSLQVKQKMSFLMRSQGLPQIIQNYAPSSPYSGYEIKNFISLY